MSTIGPGTMLVCVADEVAWPVPLLERGRVYCCAAMRPNEGLCLYDNCLEPGVVLEGVAGGRGFCPHRFIPAGHRGQFDALLTAQPKRQKTTARDLIDAADRILADG